MIKVADASDKEQVRRLWEYAFNDPDSVNDYYFERRYQTQDNFVEVHQGKVRASLMATPYLLQSPWGSERASYIVGVSVLPEARGLKLSSKLIEGVLQEKRAQKESISLLMPIDEQIYRRYGYEFISLLSVTVLELDKIAPLFRHQKVLPKLCRISGTVPERAALSRFYKQQMQGQSYYFERTEQDFERYLEEVHSEQGECFACLAPDGEVRGYLVLYTKGQPEGQLFARELFSADSETLEALLLLIAAHRTQGRSVRILSPYPSELMNRLNYTDKAQFCAKPFLMGRILEIKSVLEKLAALAGPGLESLSLYVSDPLILDNQGLYQVHKEEVRYLSREPEQAQARTDIGTLTQLVFGTLSVAEARFANRLQAPANCIGSLKALFPQRGAYFHEYI